MVERENTMVNLCYNTPCISYYMCDYCGSNGEAELEISCNLLKT